MGVDNETIHTLSDLTNRFVSFQLVTASRTSSVLKSDRWCLGYCFGFVDAIIQRMGMDQYTDGLLLMTVTFDKLLGGSGDLELGSSLVGLALNKQTERDFRDGLQKGGEDFLAYRRNSKLPPGGLHLYLRKKKKTVLEQVMGLFGR